MWVASCGQPPPPVPERVCAFRDADTLLPLTGAISDGASVVLRRNAIAGAAVGPRIAEGARAVDFTVRLAQPIVLPRGAEEPDPGASTSLGAELDETTCEYCDYGSICGWVAVR